MRGRSLHLFLGAAGDTVARSISAWAAGGTVARSISGWAAGHTVARSGSANGFLRVMLAALASCPARRGRCRAARAGDEPRHPRRKPLHSRARRVSPAGSDTLCQCAARRASAELPIVARRRHRSQPAAWAAALGLDVARRCHASAPACEAAWAAARRAPAAQSSEAGGAVAPARAKRDAEDCAGQDASDASVTRSTTRVALPKPGARRPTPPNGMHV